MGFTQVMRDSKSSQSVEIHGEYACGVSNTSGHNSKLEQTSSYSLLASQSSCPQLDHEDLDQVDEYDLTKIMDLNAKWPMISMRIKKVLQGSWRRDGWNPGNKDGSRTGKKEESKALVTVDGESVDWTTHSEDDENYAFMASNSSGSDTQVTSCSNECKESYANLKRLYDAQREELSNASVEIKDFISRSKDRRMTVSLPIQTGKRMVMKQKIKFMKIDLDDKTDVLTYHKKLLAKAQKEKDDLEVIVDKWNHSSKNLGKIVNSHMSARDKFGLGYGDYRYSGILSYENEAIICPLGPDIEIVDSKYTYGPEKDQPSESEFPTTELDNPHRSLKNKGIIDSGCSRHMTGNKALPC
ncbi:hypothetical protein Tco_0643809 [Tanacetum coccineum]